MWVAKDDKKGVHLFNTRPVFNKSTLRWETIDSGLEIDSTAFPDLKCEDEPIEVRLTTDTNNQALYDLGYKHGLNEEHNPIKDNRIVSNYTYAVRNLAFLASVYPDIPNKTCTSMDLEEFESLCIVACQLIKQQVDTCPDNEKWYFENLVNGYTNYIDIIEKHICKSRPDFLRYLNKIKAL